MVYITNTFVLTKFQINKKNCKWNFHLKSCFFTCVMSYSVLLPAFNWVVYILGFQLGFIRGFQPELKNLVCVPFPFWRIVSINFPTTWKMFSSTQFGLKFFFNGFLPLWVFLALEQSKVCSIQILSLLVDTRYYTYLQ